MASSPPLNEATKNKPFDFFNNVDLHTVATYRRLGSLNGFLIGLIISLSYWLPKVVQLARLPVWFPYTGAIGSSVAVILLCTLTGWITARVSKIVVTLLLWLITAVFVTMSLGFLPNMTHNWAIWLLDSRFSGLFIAPIPKFNSWWRFAIAGYVLIFALLLLALLQEYRLEKAHMELSAKRGLTLRSFLILFMPALLTAVAALLMPDFLGSAARQSLQMTHQVIQEGREIEGDLFEVSLERDLNYSDLKGVRDQLDGSYQLMVGEVDESGSTVVIVANFASGTWINCRVNVSFGRAKYFSFCAQGQRPYTLGFSRLLSGDSVPENCLGCLPTVDVQWQSWLSERAELLGEAPQFERIAQQGRFVLAQARSSETDYAIECMFEGLQKVSLLSCSEVE